MARPKQGWERKKQAQRRKMTVSGHKTMGLKIKPGPFMRLCLAEYQRRLSFYDERLLRPRAVPRLVALASPFLGR